MMFWNRKSGHFPVLELPFRFITSFSLLEHPFAVLECPFPVFWFLWGKLLGRPRTEEFVPGFFLLPLSRDKGTTGQGHIFVLGQRDKLKILPLDGTSWDSPSKSCHRTGRAGTACQILGRDARRDKEIFFVLWQRDNGTSQLGLSLDVPQDILSLGIPSMNLLLYRENKSNLIHASHQLLQNGIITAVLTRTKKIVIKAIILTNIYLVAVRRNQANW